MVQVMEVIITDLARKGTGKDEHSPVRSVLQIYTKEGELLAFHDAKGNFSFEDMLNFGRFCRTDPQLTILETFEKWKS